MATATSTSGFAQGGYGSNRGRCPGQQACDVSSSTASEQRVGQHVHRDARVFQALEQRTGGLERALGDRGGVERDAEASASRMSLGPRRHHVGLARAGPAQRRAQTLGERVLAAAHDLARGLHSRGA